MCLQKRQILPPPTCGRAGSGCFEGDVGVVVGSGVSAVQPITTQTNKIIVTNVKIRILNPPTSSLGILQDEWDEHDR